MGATGTTSIDFGSFVAPPAGIPSAGSGVGGHQIVTITGQSGILSGSLIEAWIMDNGAGSASHSTDEHMLEQLRIEAGNIVAGVGFDIDIECVEGGTYGVFNIAWVWA